LAGDDEVPLQLVKLLRTVRLVGAQCVVVGIESEKIAEAMEPLVPDVASLNTYSSLQAGMDAALAIMGLQICNKS